MNPARKKPRWTDAHKAEALRRTFEIATEMAAPPRRPRSKLRRSVIRNAFRITFWATTCIGKSGFETEERWRWFLGQKTGKEGIAGGNLGLDAGRIDREVRRVRGLAEGRLKREKGWRAPSPIYTKRQRTQAMTVRVTRTSKAR